MAENGRGLCGSLGNWGRVWRQKNGGRAPVDAQPATALVAVYRRPGQFNYPNISVTNFTRIACAFPAAGVMAASAGRREERQRRRRRSAKRAAAPARKAEEGSGI